VTHGVIVGMTGSGKTGLAIALIEEVMRQGVPVLAVDPKADSEPALLFDDLAPSSFAPWVDPRPRGARGGPPGPRRRRRAWRKGLATGASARRHRALKDLARGGRLHAGLARRRALNVLQSLDAPACLSSRPRRTCATRSRDRRRLLGLRGHRGGSAASREFLLLSNLRDALARGRGLTLETLIPPWPTRLRQVGRPAGRSASTRATSGSTAHGLNGLLASPTSRAGGRASRSTSRRSCAPKTGVRALVVYTAHLSDERALFVHRAHLDKVKTWTRQQRDHGAARLVYIDECSATVPPHPANPPPSGPLLTLLKQARAQGVGVVLATQNPVDLDYKGLANMGIWLVGKLQTDQTARACVTGCSTRAWMRPRSTVCSTPQEARLPAPRTLHRKAPRPVHSRGPCRNLRGPLTRDEISRLEKGRTPAPAPAGRR
jgi:hypothetical protein